MAEKMMEKVEKEPKPKTIKVGDVLAKDKPAKPKAESKDMGSKKKHKMKHTHIEHHLDGSHTVRHIPMGGGEEMSYSKPDMAGVLQGLQQHVGDAQPQPDAQQPPEPAPAPDAAQPQPQPGM